MLTKNKSFTKASHIFFFPKKDALNPELSVLNSVRFTADALGLRPTDLFPCVLNRFKMKRLGTLS